MQKELFERLAKKIEEKQMLFTPKFTEDLKFCPSLQDLYQGFVKIRTAFRCKLTDKITAYFFHLRNRYCESSYKAVFVIDNMEVDHFETEDFELFRPIFMTFNNQLYEIEKELEDFIRS